MADNEFWGTTAAVASTPVAVVAGLTNGTYKAATGADSFNHGFESAMRTVTGSAQKFGNDHGSTITRAVITGFVGLAFATARDLTKKS
jgi:hypothetical protein